MGIMAKRSKTNRLRKASTKQDPPHLTPIPTMRRSLRIAQKLNRDDTAVEAKTIVPLKRSKKLTATVVATKQKESSNRIVSNRTRKASKLQPKRPSVRVEDAKQSKKRRHQSLDASVKEIWLSGQKKIISSTESSSQSAIPVTGKAKKTSVLPKTLCNGTPVYLNLSNSCENLISSNGTLTVRTKSDHPMSSLRSTRNSNPSGANEFRFPMTIQIQKKRSTVISRRPSISICKLEPVIRKRQFTVVKDISQVRSETLPCRENECKEMFELIKGKLSEKSGGCMYVCGVPGTGKTATMSKVIGLLQESVDTTIQHFKLIQINGLQLTEPQQAYVHIFQELRGRKVRWDEAVTLLDKFFNRSDAAHNPTILVADEFDMLNSSGNRVIYNLLNWSMKASAQLFVVAIGNILDIERMGGITSRLGATRFTFLPYTQSQLQRIVRARLADEVTVYENDAVELIARKVASISGDCRRALEICRRATEIGEKDCSGKKIVVTMSHAIQAFDEMFSSPKLIAIKGCSRYEKLFLQAVAVEIGRTGADETVLFQVYRQFETICALNGVSVPEPGIALRISSRLGSSRLLICDHSSNSIHQKIMLNVTEDEMRYALIDRND